jgi:endonuclease/exonuclease/phosphatase family metal-dependent hydrolase
VLVRSWNLFHGNTVPPGRRSRLEEMVRLITSDRPDVVFLQELPLWSLGELGRWSRMQAFGDVAAPARLGPFPSTPSVGRALTSAHTGLLRSALTGQGNAILALSRLRPLERRRLVLNDRAFRRSQARWLRLGPLPRLVWAKERRVLQTVRIREGGRTVLLANLHATSCPPDPRAAEAEVLRAAVFADGAAEPEDVVILGGDLNVVAGSSQVLDELQGPAWGFARFGNGVDHLLVRGATLTYARRWPAEARRREGLLLSDHAPIEARVE